MKFSEDLKIELERCIKKIKTYELTLNYEEMLSLVISNEDYFFDVSF